MIDLFYAFLLGIVEGITEFLPISSTGHLIVTEALLGFPTSAIPMIDRKGFRNTFEIFIQLGAVLAVLVYYRRDLIQQARKLPTDRVTQTFWFEVLTAFLPAAVVGFLLRDWLTATLFNPLVVGIALVVGGLVFIVVERIPHRSQTQAIESITFRQALCIGLAQMTALIPGVSRSGASIVGGLLIGMDRPTATKFSFYLAMPTLGSATLYQMYSALREGLVVAEHLPYFAVGTTVAFVVAYLAISWLLRYVSQHTFTPFGLYRIIAGIAVVGLALLTDVLSN